MISAKAIRNQMKVKGRKLECGGVPENVWLVGTARIACGVGNSRCALTKIFRSGDSTISMSYRSEIYHKYNAGQL